MKFRKLLVMSTCVACGLTLASCGKNVEVNVGLGYSATFNAESGQIDVTTAMVAFDSNKKVVDARIDVVQVKLGVNEAGDAIELTNKNVVDGYVTTKLELGKDYNMVAYGHSVAEVDAQIESFADWTKGQTLAEVKTHLDGTKLQAGTLANCTINVKDFVDAMESAWAQKGEAVKVAKDFTTGVAMCSSLSEGNEVQVEVGGTLVSGGKIVAAAIDAIYFDVKVVDGAVALDTSSKYYDATTISKSKKVLGDAYAMKGEASFNSKLEWYEHAAIIENAAVGKTADEVLTMKKGEDELASATINLDYYLKALAKAAKYADLEHVGPQAD